MSAKPATPLWPKRRRFRLPRVRLDAADRVALRTIGVYSIAAVLVAVAITAAVLLLAIWIRLFLAVV